MSRDTATEPQAEVVRVQEQLLEMLRTAGKDAPPPRREVAAPVAVAASAVSASSAPALRQATNAPPAGTECPKCGSDIPWGKSSWCPDCGYYPKAAFEGTGVAVAEDEIAPTLIDVLPEWVYPTALGAVGIFVSSIVTRFVFTEGLQRALVAITQLLVFATVVLAVHFRATYLAIKAGRSWMAVVNFGETWKLILDKMPQTKWLILLLGWSLAGMGSSFLVGLDVDIIAEHVAQEVKKNPKVTFSDIVGAMSKVTRKAFGKKFENKNVAMAAMGQLIQATGQLSGGGPEGGIPGSDDIEGAIGNLAGTTSMISEDGGSGGTGFQNQNGSSASNLPDASASSTSDSGTGVIIGGDGSSNGSSQGTTDSNATASPHKGTVDLWIIGYTTNPDGEVRSLLLAVQGRNGRLRYSQKLGLDALTNEELSTMTEQFKPFRTREAAVSCPYGGKWMKPVVKCRMEHEGLNDDSRPVNPGFQKVIFP